MHGKSIENHEVTSNIINVELEVRTPLCHLWKNCNNLMVNQEQDSNRHDSTRYSNQTDNCMTYNRPLKCSWRASSVIILSHVINNYDAKVVQSHDELATIHEERESHKLSAE